MDVTRFFPRGMAAGWAVLAIWMFFVVAAVIEALVGHSRTSEPSTVGTAVMVLMFVFHGYAYVAVARLSRRRGRWVIVGCMNLIFLLFIAMFLWTADGTTYVQSNGTVVRTMLFFAILICGPLIWLMTGRRLSDAN